MVNLQPTLIGKLIKIRPLIANDYDKLFKSASDPQIWKMSPNPNRYKQSEFRRYFDKAIQCKGALTIQNLNDDVIGSSRYYDYNEKHKYVSIGYTFFQTKYWGKGYNKQLKLLMMNNAFKFVNKILFQLKDDDLKIKSSIMKMGGLIKEQKLQENQLKRREGMCILQIKRESFNNLQ